MKRTIMIITLSIASLFFITSLSQAAALTCSFMEVRVIGETGTWLKNVTGSSCGSIANNSSQYFVFKDSDRDRQLAILLSAMSMNKNVYINALGDAKGSIINVISLRK